MCHKLFFNILCRFAYVEFAEKEAVDTALKLDDSTFKGRQLKVWRRACFRVYCAWHLIL